MRMFSKPIGRGLLLLLICNAIPSYERIFDTFRPSWTALGRDDLEKRTGTFVRVKDGIVFAINLDTWDVHFRERWHRFRIGYPLSPITIDFEQRKKQIQGRIETNWLVLRLAITCMLWMLLESCLFLSRGESSRPRLRARTGWHARLNNSFIHGVAAYSAFASPPYFHSNLAWWLAAMICVYAGWHHRRNVAAFLGGIVLAILGWTTFGILSSPGVGAGVFFMVPFALLVLLPEALAAYVVGRVLFMIAHRSIGSTGGDA
ncbi:hypothetical protein SAMN05428966_11691 [Massilia sp. PDC64]|nr:hypothetical protein SAMN05428966_11691 [Massilia sp. PDC64]